MMKIYDSKGESLTTQFFSSFERNYIDIYFVYSISCSSNMIDLVDMQFEQLAI
jgi:hypothetical protein